MIKGKVFGYPNGIPGGWSLERKIHFVGHSQGGMTIRYMQYLLKNDYFNYGASPKVDNSDWIASFSGINPILNGGIATYLFEYCLEKKKFLSPKEGTLGSYIFVEGCKVFAIL